MRSYDPQLGRFLQSDPYDQFASGYIGMGDDPVNGADPSGGITISQNLIQSAAYAIADQSSVTVVGSLAKVGAKARSAQKLLNIQNAISGFLWNLAGASTALLDNTTGGFINLRESFAPDEATNLNASRNFRFGHIAGDGVSLAFAMMEGTLGDGMMSGGGTLALSGTGSVPGVPMVIAGAGLSAHSAVVFARAAYNLNNDFRQVKFEANENITSDFKEIEIEPENKIPREQLNPPTKRGNAPTFKKDGKSVEIHHENQNPDGPFREIHPDEHRKIPNPAKKSKIDRKQFKKQRESYWKKEFPSR